MSDLSSRAALEARIRSLEDENSRLKEAAENSVMLGLVSEAVESAEDISSGLDAALEQISLLKDVAVVAYCSISNHEATVLQSYVSFPHTEINGFSFLLPKMDTRSILMDHEHTLAFDFQIPSIDFVASEALVISSSGDKNLKHVFLFATNRKGRLLQRITPILERTVHVLTRIIENRSLLTAYKALNEKLDYRVELRSKALKESEEKYRNIIDNMQDCIYRTDKEGRLLYASPAIQSLMACELNELIGDQLSDYYVDPDGRQKLLALLHTSPDGKVDNFEAQIRRKDGKVIWLSANTRLIYDDKGQVQGVEGSLRDITSLKEMEVKFNQAQKMEAVGTLVGGIAHDFNNILAGMVGSFYLIKYKQQHNPELIRDIEALELQSFRAAEMIKQLLTFSRKGEIETKNCSFILLMQEALKLAKRTVPENIKLNIDICKETLFINGDASLLQQVLMNLINNSRDAVKNRENPCINVSIDAIKADAAFIQRHPEVALATTYVRLSIQDNGCGISKEALTHVFEPFYTTKGIGEGTGLGLSMIYGSIQSHQGLIELDSIINEGTTVDIFLPVVATGEDMGDTSSRDKLLEGDGEFILCVDDEVEICEVNSEILASFGYQVLQASDGLQAINVFEQHQDKIALLLTDVVMPNMGGVELANELWRQQPALPVIFVSGYDENHLLDIPKKNKHTCMMGKPFTVEVLSQHVHHLLESRSL